MLRCAITGGTASGFVNRLQIEQIEKLVRSWAAEGIDFIQIREKSLEPGGLLMLAEAVRRAVDETGSATRLLINGRADVAIAAGLDGVHLTADPDELTPEQVRALYKHAALPVPVVSVSCHSMEEVMHARDNHADLILFGPVFEKRVADRVVAAGAGIEALAEACRAAAPVPVLALGGISRENADACTAAGAAGIAGIRTFS